MYGNGLACKPNTSKNEPVHLLTIFKRLIQTRKFLWTPINACNNRPCTNEWNMLGDFVRSSVQTNTTCCDVLHWPREQENKRNVGRCWSQSLTDLCSTCCANMLRSFEFKNPFSNYIWYCSSINTTHGQLQLKFV